MVVGVSVNNKNLSTRMDDFLCGYDKIPLLIMWRTKERHILPSVCVSAP